MPPLAPSLASAETFHVTWAIIRAPGAVYLDLFSVHETSAGVISTFAELT